MGCVVEGQFPHPFYGPMDIWLHQAPGAVA
jgi:hypothetical protein